MRPAASRLNFTFERMSLPQKVPNEALDTGLITCWNYHYDQKTDNNATLLSAIASLPHFISIPFISVPCPAVRCFCLICRFPARLQRKVYLHGQSLAHNFKDLILGCFFLLPTPTDSPRSPSVFRTSFENIFASENATVHAGHGIQPHGSGN